MTEAARYFGARVNSTGSRPITRSASISSVTTMVPISAEMADADRPLTLRAVMSGPSSLVKLIATKFTTNSTAPNLRSSEAPCSASMNPVHSAIMPVMGSALAPIASICSTAERQRLLSPTIGNTRGSFRSTDQNCMVNAPASSTWTIAACPTCSRNVNGTPPPIPTHEKPNPVGLFPRASWPCRLSPSPAVSPNVREQPSMPPEGLRGRTYPDRTRRRGR